MGTQMVAWFHDPTIASVLRAMDGVDGGDERAC
jgi:hypothetical protein